MLSCCLLSGWLLYLLLFHFSTAVHITAGRIRRSRVSVHRHHQSRHRSKGNRPFFPLLSLIFLDCFVAIAPRKDNKKYFFNRLKLIDPATGLDKNRALGKRQWAMGKIQMTKLKCQIWNLSA